MLARMFAHKPFWGCIEFHVFVVDFDNFIATQIQLMPFDIKLLPTIGQSIRSKYSKWIRLMNLAFCDVMSSYSEPQVWPNLIAVIH